MPLKLHTDCRHDTPATKFQDEKYGYGMRSVTVSTKEPKLGCSGCGKYIPVSGEEWQKYLKETRQTARR